MLVLWSILGVILAYLIGSISTSTVIVKMLTGSDIRQHGSKSAGATNTVRVLGIRWGIAVLLVDLLKGMIALWIVAGMTQANPVALSLSAVFVVIGHNWPIFFAFRGGKGIATTIGVLLWLAPWMTVVALIICVIVIGITRYVSLGSLVFTVLMPILIGIWGAHDAALFAAIILALLSIYRHRENIARLVRGEERKLFDGGRDVH